MAERTRYLLAYDITNPKRLRRVHKVAKAFGYPLQYSVFVCDLDGVELVAMRSELLAVSPGASAPGSVEAATTCLLLR